MHTDNTRTDNTRPTVPWWIISILTTIVVRSDEGQESFVRYLAEGGIPALTHHGWMSVADALVAECVRIHPDADVREYQRVRRGPAYDDDTDDAVGHAALVVAYRTAAAATADDIKPLAGVAWFWPQSPVWERIGRALMAALLMAALRD